MKLDDNDRLYMRFRARDRFRLMCQAAVRLDINELKRLAATARRVPVLVPHHYFDAHAFRLLNEEHHLHMQELALGIVLLQTQSERGVDCHPAIDLACWDLLRYREGW